MRLINQGHMRSKIRGNQQIIALLFTISVCYAQGRVGRNKLRIT